eukprot:gene4880-6837_t
MTDFVNNPHEKGVSPDGDENGLMEALSIKDNSIKDNHIDTTPIMIDYSKPLIVVYCPTCTMPPEFCEFGASFQQCLPWILENCPESLSAPLRKELTGEGPDGIEATEEKQRKFRGSGAAPLKKAAQIETKVVISRVQRQKRKYVTVVVGLETVPDLKLKDATRAFGRKFSSGASIGESATGKKEVVIQGDVFFDLPGLLINEFKIPANCIYLQEDDVFKSLIDKSYDKSVLSYSNIFGQTQFPIMEDHFSRMLAPALAGSNKSGKKLPLDFMPAASFDGRREGYIFKRGGNGLGYYIDKLLYPSNGDVDEQNDLAENNIGIKKRKRVLIDGNDDDDPEENDIDRLLREAESTEIAQLDSNSLKQLLLNFEKKITKNQKMRMKYPDEPEKFLDSEMELHAEIQELYAVAASPELYPILIQTGSINSILGMIPHENTDISLASIGLLQEMTDPDSIGEESLAVNLLIDSLMEKQGSELIVQNISRLDESNDEDAQGINNSLAIIEHMIEIKPEVAVIICEKTHILKYLLNRIKIKKFDAIKLYCSEILSILLQADSSNTIKICNLSDCDGMDLILQCIAQYRKKDIDLVDEQEFVENLFLCLNAILLHRENQFKFLACEGFELIIRCIKEQKYVSVCAINAISYAITKNKACCEKLVDLSGLKYLFPLIMGKGIQNFKQSSKKKGKVLKKDIEESTISAISQLCTQLYNSRINDYYNRILFKFIENEHEKLEKCIELYIKYCQRLAQTEASIESTRQMLINANDEEDLAEFDDEDNIYAQRLEGGLFYMQQLAIIITFACISDKSSLQKAELKLSMDDLSLSHILTTLREIIVVLIKNSNNSNNSNNNENKNDISNDNNNAVGNIEESLDFKYKKLLTEWSAMLATLISE